MTPSWYDVLGVDDDATTDEIRTAWQEAVAGLDPTDRRFKQRNRAAEVLLDADRRTAHDRELAAQDDDWDDPAPVAPVAAEVDGEERRHTAVVVLDKQTPDAVPDTASDTAGTDEVDRLVGEPAAGAAGESAGTATVPGGSPPSRGLVGSTVVLAVLALVLLALVAVSLARGGDGSDGGPSSGGALPDSRQVDAARKAAESAAGPVLSYDYRDLDKSFAAARSFMTPAYQEVYDQNVAGYVRENAPTTKTIVTATVVNSGIVRTGKDRVDVLVFVNRPTRNASGDSVSRDQVTVRMLDVDDRWLVDCLVTAPGGTC